jgi:hypothetical protein
MVSRSDEDGIRICATGKGVYLSLYDGNDDLTRMSDNKSGVRLLNRITDLCLGFGI